MYYFDCSNTQLLIELECFSPRLQHKSQKIYVNIHVKFWDWGTNRKYLREYLRKYLRMGINREYSREY